MPYLLTLFKTSLQMRTNLKKYLIKLMNQQSPMHLIIVKLHIRSLVNYEVCKIKIEEVNNH